MIDKIKDYLRIMQRIAMYRSDVEDEYAPTPYTFNMQRTDCHDKLFEEILPHLHLVDGFAREDAYWRSKEIFSRLDKVFKIFNEWDLDLKNTDDINILAKDLDRYLLTTEVRYYLEGRTPYLRHVIEPDDE